MAQLVLFSASAQPRRFPLFRGVTTIGSDETCDVHLSGAAVKEIHAEIVAEGRIHQIRPADSWAEILVNGRKTKKVDLSNWDVIRIGNHTLTYSPDDIEFDNRDEAEKRSFKSLESLGIFSRNLMNTKNLDQALTVLLDETLSITQASKGFIIFVENDVPRIRVARNIDRKMLPDDEALFSESILEKALKDGEPQLVTDAMNNQAYSNCTSVINLKLASVMCLPLKVGGSTLGALYLGTERLLDLFDDVKLRSLMVYAAQAAIIIQNVQLIESLVKDNKHLKTEVSASRFGTLIGSSPSMLSVFNRISRVAPTDVPVLVLGETGTGKELVARELHARSERAQGPFVAINCGAIPENLLESELFGHVRGAFTGAITAAIGKFQAANRGTLFLDEVGELPLSLQVKLLRVLQDSMVSRVGGSRPEKVDIRLICATNKDLAREVKTGAFREDLFYRIAVVTVDLPPLRNRGDDIDMLSRYFLKKFTQEFSSTVRGFSPESLSKIREYSWPGNIRELENRIRKSVLFCDEPQISPENLDIPEDSAPAVESLTVARERFERTYVLQILERNGGNRSQTARDLGVDARTIFRYLEKERNAGHDF